MAGEDHKDKTTARAAGDGPRKIDRRDVLKGHPRSDPNRPLTGVFYTRSPARPNPLGLHPVTVREINSPSREVYGATRATRLKIGPIEAFDGTPVVDIKSASTRADG